MPRVLILCLIIATLCFASLASAKPFDSETIAVFEEPWAMTFLPDGNLLVTEMRGQLWLIEAKPNGARRSVNGIPEVDYGGQGGLGDVVLHPNFPENQLVYISYVESGEGSSRGAVVSRGRLEVDEQGNALLADSAVIWRQSPKVSGKGHYGHRLLFDAQGYLFISSGERQKFDPAQDMSGNLGKILRLHDDGSIPEDNPFYEQGGVTAEIWSLGHRNPLGLAFDEKGQLWNAEMGPLHGDELNLVKRGADYGYPSVSNGDHYSRKKIPDHHTRPEFEAPMVWWDKSIAPAELIFYSGAMFPEWQGSALIAGLKSKAIIRVETRGQSAKEAERFEMNERIRELEQGADGSLWVLEDGDNGKLLNLTNAPAE